MDFGPQDVLWIVVFIGLLVFVHELGHFVVAKAFNIKVVRFSIGFGPRLLSVTRAETEYCICALPLGGYVKMVGLIPGEAIAPEDSGRAFIDKSVTVRALVAFAGPAFNFLLALVVFFGLLVGEQTFGKPVIGIVGYDSPAWQAGMRPGDEIIALGGQPVREWQALRTLIGVRAGDVVPLTIRRGTEEKSITVEPRKETELDGLRQKIENGRIGVINLYLKPIVAVVDEGSPAWKVGVRTGDYIEKVNGKEINAWHEVKQAVRAHVDLTQPLQLSVKRYAEPGAPPASTTETHSEAGADTRTPEFERLTFSVMPDTIPQGLLSIPRDLPSTADCGPDGLGYTGLVSADTVLDTVEKEGSADLIDMLPGDRLIWVETNSTAGASWSRWVGTWAIGLRDFYGAFSDSRFTITFQRGKVLMEHELELTKQELTDEFKNTEERHAFGARNITGLMEVYTFKRDVGVTEAALKSLSRLGQSMTQLVRAVGLMVTGKLPNASVAGPIALGYMAAKAARMSWATYFGLMAFLSVNLGIMNLLPVPVLDGGHLLFCLLEAVQRRKPSQRTMERAYMVGFVLLILLMAFVITRDFSKYVLG